MNTRSFNEHCMDVALGWIDTLRDGNVLVFTSYDRGLMRS